MKSKTIVIGLLADRVDVLVCHGGQIVLSRRFPFSWASEAPSWIKAVRAASKPLAATIEELGAAGSPAVVVYRSPSEVADFSSSRLPLGQAVEAAKLSCADALTFPMENAVCESMVVGQDRSKDTRQTHLVTAAERSDVADAIVEMVEEAGLKFESATPMDAAVMGRIAGQAITRSQGLEARLFVGEYNSFLAIVNQGVLLFARRIALGVDALAVSLTRPIRVKASAEPIQFDLPTARSILHEHGFSDRGRIVHEPTNLTGGHLIPSLQPVLQRFIVELRQSLRFGLPEADRETITITVSGPGSAVPGFVQTLSAELGLRIVADQGYAAYDCHRADSPGGEVAEAAADRRILSQLNLQPRQLSRRKTLNRMRRWLWTGAAAAVCLMVMDGLRAGSAVREARRLVEQLAGQSEDAAAMEATAARLNANLAAMTALERTISDQAGAKASYAACLKELSRLTPGSIRFNSINFFQSDARTIGSVNGYAMRTQSSGEGTELESLIAKLRGSPLFESAVLDNVQVTTLGESPAQRFEASFVGIAAPVDPASSRVVSADEGHQP